MEQKFNKPNIILENKFKLIIKNHTWNKNKFNKPNIILENKFKLIIKNHT